MSKAKKPSVLNNPIVAAVLGVLALIALYLQVIAPMAQKPSFEEPDITASVAEAPHNTEASYAKSPMADAESTSPENTIILNGDSPLARIGWRRQARRDPFRLEDRKGKIPWWITQNEPPPPRPRRQRATGSTQTSGILKAWTRGPQGSAALVDGRVVLPGQSIGNSRVEHISSDTLILRGPQGSRTLIFAPGGSP